MTNEAQSFIDRMKNKEKLTYLELSNQELTGSLNLENFTSLSSINAYKNKFTSLNFLLTLSNKIKLKKLNFWGNQITSLSEILIILDQFPHLESINLGGNPLDWNGLSNLTDQQILSLTKAVEGGKVKINSNSSEMALLKHIRQLKEENILLKQQIEAQIETPPKK
ncbi:MAG: hypothetical protein I3273_00690 [Candidatus Moeniiplasma glomeromycotorum]|nr:hypothetical protein [Candidatus Moeniiplasma glomeromycotorum]MCE8167360.1 hypothetical protein [Candidatus Moeniiplasma glomeromycotorum]MCE8168627.1 hypothetical protein [Candidatus Moeniiplasma glomeromycotorum]